MSRYALHRSLVAACAALWLLVGAPLLPRPTGLLQAQTGSKLDRAYGDMLAASRALREAESRLERGAEPLPGERLGIVGGRSRLGPAYEERQKRLNEDVARARQRMSDAVDRWNAVRGN